MNTFGKSFLGAASGTVLVILMAVAFINFNQENNTVQPAIPVAQPAIGEEYRLPPIHQTSFAAPQCTDFTKAAEKSVNAVVHIKTEMRVKNHTYDDFFGPFRDYFGNPHRSNTYVAFGSGVIISTDGYIVTNNHVVEGADKITVTFNNKKELEATLIGNDPSTDLALIKVEDNNLVNLTYGNSDELKVGEWVLAVGNPFNLTSTVTAGIVSAKARNINILGSRSAVESFIQTDAAINRGNSGGALVNAEGELVGINAAIASHTGVYEGYSFAIPVNIVSKVMGDLKKYGKIQRAYIGVQITDINAEFAEKLGLDEVRGVYVAGVVEDGGADEAGIKEGDVIMSINQRPTNSLSELMGTVAQHSPGDVLTIVVNRDDQLITSNVTLKNQNNNTSLVKSGDSFFNGLLGATLKQVSRSEASDLYISNGLKVIDISDGILRRGGITEDFIITEINGNEINSQNSLEMALRSTRGNSVRLKGVYPNGTKVSYEFML